MAHGSAKGRPGGGSTRRRDRGTDRAIAALAVPAFGALVAQPLFLLVDAAVVGTLVALQQPLAGPVFALDGVLIGAGDGRWLAGAGTVMLIAFLPAAWLVLAHDLGVVGLWWALTWFMVVRAVLLTYRARGDAWLTAARSP